MAKKITVKTIKSLFENGEKIAVLTAYDYSTAKYIDEAGAEIILVGDSLANVALGYESTHSVSMNEMLIFVGAVARGVSRSMVIADMPFMSYNISVEEAIRNAGEFVRAGANAVKIEGCNDYILNVIKRCTQSGIPVLGHLGFTPQSKNTIGGNLIQGKTLSDTLNIFEQAKQLQEAGVFAVVLELVPEESSQYITERLNVPTIGIGAGRYCSGQVLVSDDMLGKFSDYKPHFARQYANMKDVILSSSKSYIEDVKNKKFPSEDEVFKLSEEELFLLKKEGSLC
ncbi:TPA: 3-methyl-2-oxobutanoate hydroxymethyltransferase [Candidatus Gastranaerophilales bacterium HUM_9]|nr:MAG TPA: 3-methyl-2-oxobutanoate hydroxymethyltransferase [Candidatus Gastranaerophilales bacterium HUM_9]HBX34717.1 3-methyl-2-oxobutanoate hydroxymethyltransferase [Cyanobacteria bacterium UBA11440]